MVNRNVNFELVDVNNETDKNMLIDILEKSFGDEFIKLKEQYIESLNNECNLFFITYGGIKVGSFELKNNLILASFCVIPEYRRLKIATKILDILTVSFDNIYINSDTDMSRDLYKKYKNIIIINNS